MTQAFTADNLYSLFEELKAFSKETPQGGITRLAYTDLDEQAHQFLMDKLTARGLIIRQDKIGNVYATLPGSDSSLGAIATGSHVDTVPSGGAFDGAAGVLAGIYALLQFAPKQLKRDLTLIIFRAEESSRFGFSCIGSKVITDKVNRDKWSNNRDSQGLNFFEAIEKVGYDGSDAGIAASIITQETISSFIEVHIEQGKCLEAIGKRIGVVTGIAAPTRFKVEVAGHADHSGATPMNQRHDALVAASDVIKDIHLAACHESCHGTVGTVGKLDVYPNSMNVIPGSVTFYVDIRGVEVDSIARVVERFKASVTKAAFDNQVAMTVHEISQETPVKLDETLCQTLEQVCQEKGVDYMTMLSGAGHDSMNMASICPTAMLFIPSKEGVSHHPDEHSEFDDLVLASELLADAMKRLANQ